MDRLFKLVDNSQRRQARVSKFTIQSALQAVEHFCSENGGSLDSATIVEIAFAWQTARDTYEWTPLATGFRRITFVAPDEVRDKVVIVDNYTGVDAEKTRYLNTLIANFTHGKWAEVPA